MQISTHMTLLLDRTSGPQRKLNVTFLVNLHRLRKVDHAQRNLLLDPFDAMQWMFGPSIQ